MKAKKAAKQPVLTSVGSNGVVKKNKKKDKSLAQKMSTGSKMTEAVIAASGIATPLSPRNKKSKKKNKKKKKNLQDPDHGAAGGIASDTKEVEMKNGDIGSQNLSGNITKVGDNTLTPVDTSHCGASPEAKKAQEKNKVNLQPGNTGVTDFSPGSQGDAGTVKKSNKGKKGAQSSQAKEKLSRTPENTEEMEQRTVFVGNVSIKTTRRSLARFFSKYGKVEAVRLRCAAVPALYTSKRQAVIMNNFHEKRSSLNAYVRFSEAAMAEAALRASGAELDQKHLQVDRSQRTSGRNTKLAVFIGNLAYEAEEEALRSHFTSCGEMESVRIVRDKKLSSGKGFGYINFVSEDAVEMALQMDGKVFMHRQLRVQRCAKQGKKGTKAAFRTRGKKGLAFMKVKPASLKTSKKQANFSGKKMMETKKFKKMKAKSKYTKEDRKKKAIAHKLAGDK